jgi:glucokinase
MARGPIPPARSRATSLLADIGGTNARFALRIRGRLEHPTTLAVADFASPLEAIREYLTMVGEPGKPVRATLAAGGPVDSGTIALTNAPWVVDGEAIRRALGLTSVLLVNDFAALAHAIPTLTRDDIRPLGGGARVEGAPVAVIGPGTGFGVAALLRGPQGESVLATEGGHASLGGESRREDAVVQTLRDQLGYASVEAVLSGDGLGRLYRAVAAIDGLDAPARDAAGIVSHALARSCAASHAALELFCSFLGTAAGNIALTLGARGGVYIGGGIVPRFTGFLAQSAFRARFEGKGPMRGYLAAIPTAVITHAEPTFLGLARLDRKAARRGRRERA